MKSYRDMRLKGVADNFFTTLYKLGIGNDWWTEEWYMRNVLPFVENYDMRNAISENNRLLRELVGELDE